MKRQSFIGKIWNTKYKCPSVRLSDRLIKSYDIYITRRDGGKKTTVKEREYYS